MHVKATDCWPRLTITLEPEESQYLYWFLSGSLRSDLDSGSIGMRLMLELRKFQPEKEVVKRA